MYAIAYNATRAFEWDIPPPWTQARRRLKTLPGRLRQAWRWLKTLPSRLRQRLRREETRALAELHGRVGFGGELQIKTRPAPLPPTATETERIDWLERYVHELEVDLEGIPHRINIARDEAIERATAGDMTLRDELEAERQKRLKRLRESLRNQAIGAVCIAIGLVLATVGSVV